MTDPRRSPRFAGVPTFCRFPLAELVEPDCLPLDWAVYGVPSDAGVTYRPGARFGPRAVRDASQYVKCYHIEHDIDIREVLSVADAGDSPVRPFRCRETLDEVHRFALSLGEPGHTKLLAVGGDHSLAYANIKATWERLGSPAGGLAVLHFDSHIDTVDQVFGERWSHASPFIRAIEDGLIDPKRMLSVGVKGPLNSRNDLAYAREQGIELVTYEDWAVRDGQTRIDTFLLSLGEAPAYLTFDVDCIDPCYAPGTGTPSCGGFTPAEIFRVLRSLAGVNLAGADVVEVLPDRDVNQNTALLAGHAIFEILCLDALNRASGASRGS